MAEPAPNPFDRTFVLYHLLPRVAVAIVAFFGVPVALHLAGFDMDANPLAPMAAVVAAAVLLAYGVFGRLPELRIPRPEQPRSLLPVVALLSAGALMGAEGMAYRGHRTTPIDFAELVDARPGETYLVAWPAERPFAEAWIAAEHTTGKRQTIVIVTPFGALAERRVFLVEMPMNEFAPGLSGVSESHLVEGRERVFGSAAARYAAAVPPGARALVKRLAPGEIPEARFAADDIVVQWNIDTPESEGSFVLFLVVVLFLAFVGFVGILPAFRPVDEAALARLRAESDLWRRLFANRR